MEDAEEEEKEEEDTGGVDQKTRGPHNFVGKKKMTHEHIIFSLNPGLKDYYLISKDQ